MTNTHKANQCEQRAEFGLLSTHDAGDSLGFVLAMNSLRRAFARLTAFTNLTEPHWAEWSSLLVAARSFSAADLLSPKKHTACRLMVNFAQTTPSIVRSQYTRAYFGEIQNNLTCYEQFMFQKNIPSHIIETVLVLAAHEKLLRNLESLHRGPACHSKLEILAARHGIPKAQNKTRINHAGRPHSIKCAALPEAKKH